MLQVCLKKAWHNFQLDISFSIPLGKITVLFGHSGAGKSSILRMISGLETPDEGVIRHGNEVWFDGVQRVHLPPQRRSIGFVLQDYTLFPHMTVGENIAYGIQEKDRLKEVKTLLSLAGLDGYEGRYPTQLSGGQKQRVALLRALARKPGILLLDEPFSAVDLKTRRQLQEDIKRIIKNFSVTTLYVTHEVTEAYNLADYVIVLEEGQVVRQGTPEEVFLGKRLSTRIQVAGKVVGIEYDSIMAAVTVSHADQYFKIVTDTEEIQRSGIMVGDNVIIGAKSSDTIVFRTLS